MGVCKKIRDLLDAILLLGNTLMIHKNTMHSRYVMLGLVKLNPYMSYDTQVRLSKTQTCFILTKKTHVYSYKTRTHYREEKHVHIMEKQNAHAFWRSKTRTRFREEKCACIMENHKNWFWCMVMEMNKNNSLHHQDLGHIVIFLHH